jgi:hypothetical protein
MALLIPRLGAARFDSGGEQRLAERLGDKLEENALVWHNVPVGPRGRHPDFLILHPHQGLLVLEVKDWRIDSIARADKLQVQLITSHGLVTTANPSEQAREYMFAVKNLLERDAFLQCPPESAFAGKLAAPFGFGVVLTNITRKQFDATDLRDVIAPSRVLCRDEMAEGVDDEVFRTSLWRMVSPRLGPALTLPQIDRIRGLVFPEIVLSDDRQRALFTDVEEDSDERLLRVMDLQQEQLARSIGEGHRIVRGVAGSGKTMLLTFRAEQVAKVATRPVLVLCYAGTLAARLEAQMQDRGIEDRVVVHTFHRWCRRMLFQYGLPVPRREDFADDDALFAAMVDQMIGAVDAGLIPVGQYDAVLIDEAHDFEQAWLQLAARMVNPETKSLFIVYDNAQSIYGKRKTPVWSHLGIEAKGRTTVMKLNYRNTNEICAFARKFAADILAEPFEDEEGLSTTMLPESSGRRGVEPIVQKRTNANDEAQAAALWLAEKHRAGYAWRDMVVLAPGKRNWRDPLAKALEREDIPTRMLLGDKKIGPDFIGDHVHVMTLHAVKGLEFPAVAVVGIGDLPWKSQTLEDAARLLYVAMTRATHALLILHSKRSDLVLRLLAI